jgi:ABC-type thiamin/hydroxymethylpyrimidine transport system permease subunit
MSKKMLLFQTNQKTKGKTHLKIATVDLTLITLFAALGIVSKNIIHPLVAFLAGPLYIPTGSIAGGIYMMWFVILYGLVRKPGAATFMALIQAFMSLLMPYGNFGVFSFIIYLAPGIAVDGFFLLTRQKASNLASCMGATAVANVVGTYLVGSIILVLPQIPLLFTIVLAAISGLIGGFFANILLKRLNKIQFFKKG